MTPNFHSRTPAMKNMAPPTISSISAVPRSGCISTSPTGTSDHQQRHDQEQWGGRTSSSEAPWK